MKEKIKQLFELYAELEPFIIDRAKRHISYNLSDGDFDRIEIEPKYDSVEVVFSGYSRGEWNEQITLTMEELCMSDEDFDNHIKELERKYNEKEEERKKREKESLLKKDREKYEELKKKFES